eukprot:NODE_275_length_12088_cov_0.250813.p7 type:complete len:256 gc:universal NODE_275_length_12088_cov_0.250813:3925-3158(-)
MKFRIFNKKKKAITISMETQTENQTARNMLVSTSVQTDLITAPPKPVSICNSCQSRTRSDSVIDDKLMSTDNTVIEEGKKEAVEVPQRIPPRTRNSGQTSSFALDPISESESDDKSSGYQFYKQDKNVLGSVFDHCDRLIVGSRSLKTDDEDDKPLLSPNSLKKKTQIKHFRNSNLNRSNSARQVNQPKLLDQINTKQHESQLMRTTSVRNSQRKFRASLQRSPSQRQVHQVHEQYLTPEKSNFILSWAQQSGYD